MRHHPASAAAVRSSTPPLAEQPADNMIAVASGKGGVGKTWLSITLAHCLADAGRKVLLFDGDLGLANVDIQLGLMPARDLMEALDGRASFNDVVTRDAATGIHLVAGRSGQAQLADASAGSLDRLCHGLALAGASYDNVILDLGAGIDLSVRRLAARAARALVVTNVEPTALTDAYALIKLLHQAGRGGAIEVVVNAATSIDEGEKTWRKLEKACQNFLDFSPGLAGIIRADTHVPEAIRRQTPLLTRHPTCRAITDVQALAKRIMA